MEDKLEVVLVEDLEVFFVELVDEGFARRDFDRDDLLRGEVFKHHDDRAEGVAVGGDEDFLARVDFRGDLLVEIGFDALSGVDEAFGDGAILDRHLAFFDEVLIFLLVAGPAFVALLKGKRRNIGAAAPDVDLFIAPLLGGFGFVEALEGAVMTLVEAPGIVLRGIDAEFAEGEVHRAVGAFEDGRESDVEVVALFLEGGAGGFGFIDAGFGKIDVGPAGEEVFEVPFGLSVTEQD